MGFFIIISSQLFSSLSLTTIYSAWLDSKDMTLLEEHEVRFYLKNQKRSRELFQGFRHALGLDPKLFVDKQELEERGQNAEVDQLESEHDDNQDNDSKTKPDVATTSKKRKRESDVESKQEKAPKVKKDSAEQESAADNGRMNGVKSKTMGELEDEGDNDVDDDGGLGTSKRASPPLTKEAKCDKDDGDNCDPFFLSFINECSQRFSLFPAKNSTAPQVDQVRDWRRRLQKAFFSNDSDALPKSEVRSSLYHHHCIVWHLIGILS